MSKTFEVSYDEITKDYSFYQIGELEVVEVPFHRKFRLNVYNSISKEEAFVTLQKFISDYYEKIKEK